MPRKESFDALKYAAGLLEEQVNPLDPVDWARKKAGIHLWSKQQEIIRSIITNKTTSVQSGHGIGKSLTASVAAAWWVDTHPPEDTLVVSTAPSVKQVHAILWEEIRKIHARAKLPGEVQISDNWLIGRRLVGFGRKPQDHDRDAFQGLHRKYVLVILDEACGIPEWLWLAASAITTGDNCRILAIGNPTDPSSYFRKVCRPGSGWNTIKISVLDSPRFTGEYLPPEVIEDLTGPDWVERSKVELGEGSALWKAKVEGEFPGIDEFSVIPMGWIEDANQRWLEWEAETGGKLDGEARQIIGADIARFGGDRTAFAYRFGDVFTSVETMPKKDTLGTATMLARKLVQSRGDLGVVDTNGVGAGTYDALKKAGHYSLGINVGNRTSLTDSSGQVEFYNLRAALMWKLREALDPARSPRLCLPPDDQLAVDLSSPRWKTVPGGKIVIESKDDLRRRIGRSPDRGDAVALAWWASSGGVLTDIGESSFNWIDRVTHETDETAISWDDTDSGDSDFADFDPEMVH
jgi:hypothetical protein